jgi:hypothetical protein
MIKVVITKEEQRAIRTLKQLAKKWPDTLMLFSWSGSLCVMKKDVGGLKAVIETIHGISNDGGDPDCGEDVHYEDDFEVVLESSHD